MYSLINTIKNGPLMYQHSDWKTVCDIIRGKGLGAASAGQSSKLFNGKLLVIMGDSDAVVVEKDLSADLSDMLGGSEHVDSKIVPGGHGFPVPSSSDVVKHICDFWHLPATAPQISVGASKAYH